MEEKFKFNITQAKPEDLIKILHEIEHFSMKSPKDYFFKPTDIVFIAKNKGKIFGFVTIFPEGHGRYEIASLFTRLGYDRKGMGMKLLGIANSYLIGVQAKHVTINLATGRRLVGKKIVLESAERFYNRTNYSPTERMGIPKYEWFPKPNPRVRKPKAKPAITLPKVHLLRHGKH